MSLMSTLEAAAGTRSKIIRDHCLAPGTPKKKNYVLMKTQEPIYSSARFVAKTSIPFKLFSKHNINEHENKILELEKFKYIIGAM